MVIHKTQSQKRTNKYRSEVNTWLHRNVDRLKGRNEKARPLGQQKAGLIVLEKNRLAMKKQNNASRF